MNLLPCPHSSQGIVFFLEKNFSFQCFLSGKHHPELTLTSFERRKCWSCVFSNSTKEMQLLMSPTFPVGSVIFAVIFLSLRISLEAFIIPNIGIFFTSIGFNKKISVFIVLFQFCNLRLQTELFLIRNAQIQTT